MRALPSPQKGGTCVPRVRWLAASCCPRTGAGFRTTACRGMLKGIQTTTTSSRASTREQYPQCFATTSPTLLWTPTPRITTTCSSSTRWASAWAPTAASSCTRCCRVSSCWAPRWTVCRKATLLRPGARRSGACGQRVALARGASTSAWSSTAESGGWRTPILWTAALPASRSSSASGWAARFSLGWWAGRSASTPCPAATSPPTAAASPHPSAAPGGRTAAGMPRMRLSA
mmetsp:Transcript_27618/g.69227  ORF Transcript_27618/g.69227 Transcript_27618/m.69227 type:complete len:231 (-) Transcript_27618:258-950(-)